MRRVRKFWLFVVAAFFCVAPTHVATAQEKEKQKSGTTVDSWRQALPAEAEVPATPEETPGAASTVAEEESRKVLLALEARWMESLKIGDAESLSEIVASEFEFTSPRLATQLTDRSKYLEFVLRSLKLTSYELDKTAVRVFGRTAIVSILLTQTATVAGENWTGTYLVTDVWLSRGGVWRVVSRHESPSLEKK